MKNIMAIKNYIVILNTVFDTIFIANIGTNIHSLLINGDNRKVG